MKPQNMKPERINIFALLRDMAWGIFQILPFDTPAKAEHFQAFIHDMADNHGRNVACELDETHTRVKLLVSANADGVEDARWFSDKVLDIFADWSTPETDTPVETDQPTQRVN